jgi:hypothetical protein
VDPCGFAFLAAFFVAVVAFVGHGIWVLAAIVFKKLYAVPEDVPSVLPARKRQCAGCGRLMFRGEIDCPSCGLDSTGPVAMELRELERMARRMQAFQDSSALERETCEQVYRAIEARQRELLETTPKGRPAPQPAVVEAPVPAKQTDGDAAAARPLAQPAPPLVEPVAPAVLTSAGPAEAPPPPAPTQAPPPPPPPRRSLAEVLAAFMEERNILWGELVGGLLIIGCSIALVISLWQTLEQIPYFPFLIMAALTVVVIGAGLYTLAHWKLESTSRGLLVIGTLLVPLNFLVLAGLSREQAGGVWEIVTECLALVGFFGLVLLAGRVLVRPTFTFHTVRPHWLLAAAIVGASASQLLVPRLLEAEQDMGRLLGLGLIPAACHGIAGALVLRGLARLERVDGRQANTLFTFIGMSTFAVGVALGFILYLSENLRIAFQGLAIPVALAGIPLMIAGALVHRKLEGDTRAPEEPPAEEWAGGLSPAVARFVGTATALTGTLVLLVALGLAWPVPWVLAVVGLVNFAAMTAVALRYGLPIANAPAIASLVIGYLAAYRVLAERFGWTTFEPGQPLLHWMFSPLSGGVLIPLVLLLAATSEGLLRRNRRQDGTFHLGGAGIIGLVSLLLVGLDAPGSPERAAVAYGLYSVAAFLVNARWRQPLISHGASVVLFGCLLAGLHWAVPDLTLIRLVLMASLCHATLLLTAASLLEWMTHEDSRPVVNRVFLIPMRDAAIVASVVAWASVLESLEWSSIAVTAWCAGWLAGLWLVVAWQRRSPAWFSAFQLAVVGAVVLAGSAGLEEQAWFGATGRAVYHPRSLHVYGLCLAGLNLLWLGVRWARRYSVRGQMLFDAAWPIVDQIVLAALVVGQLALAIWAVIPGVIHELTPAGSGAVRPYPLAQRLAFEPAAWALAGLLALALVAALWDKRARFAVVGLVLLAVTGAVLAAGETRNGRAVASTLRWELGLCFVACSIGIWLRESFSRQFLRLGMKPALVGPVPRILRSILIVLTVVPVLAITVVIASLGFAGRPPLGPLPGTFFDQMGTIASNVVPPALVSLGLAGYAIRLRSAGYAFAAGLTANVCLMGGYALGVVTGGGTLDATEWVRTLQLGMIGMAVWALAWMLVRQRLFSEARPFGDLRPSKLFNIHIGLCVALLGLVVIPALWLLTLRGASQTARVALYPPAHAWTIAAGTGLGLAALILVSLPVRLRRLHEPRELSLFSSDWLDVSALAVFACTVERLAPGWGYRALMLGWAGYAAVSAYVARWDKPRRRWGLWLTGLVAGAAALLGVFAGATYQDHLWGAAAVYVIGVAMATLALGQRHEAWTFASTSCFAIVTAFVIWHRHLGTPVGTWWGALVHAVLITAGGACLVWLATRRHIYRQDRPTLSTSPLLAAQIALVIGVNAIVLGGALVPMLVAPSGLIADWIMRAGHIAGWPALLVPLAAGLWYLAVARPRAGVHGVGVAGVLLGVLAACSAARWSNNGWLAQHVLVVSWSLAALIVLVAVWSGASLPRVGPLIWSEEQRNRAAQFLATAFPISSSRRWVETLAVFVVLLSLRGAWEDPARPYWSSGAVLAVAVLLGTMALWSHRAAYVVGSALMLNVIAFLAWTAWGPGTLATFITTQVMALALASVAWSAIAMALRQQEQPVDVQALTLPFRSAAALIALHVMGILVLGGLASDLTGNDIHLGGLLSWLALVATATALGFIAWDGRARGSATLAPLYATGLLAVGLSLHQAALTPERLAWAAGLLLAAYVLAMAGVAWAVLQFAQLRRLLHHEPQAEAEPALWFMAAQAIVAALLLTLSVWMSLDFEHTADRLAGPLAAVLLTTAGVIMAELRFDFRLPSSAAGAQPRLQKMGGGVRYVTLTIGVIALGELGWALLDPALPAPWLQRTAVATACVAAMSLAYGAALPRLLAPVSAWGASARRLALLLLGLTCLAFSGLLVQEFWLYDPETRHTPLILPLVLLGAATFAGLLIAFLVFAVAPRRDPLALSERRRTLYVYSAESLLVLLLVHLRLNIPDLFPSVLSRYWVLVIMTVAFVGVGLSEWFQRRGLQVLAEPLQRTGLFLPLLPVLAFLVRPLAQWRTELAATVPGAQPLLRYLDRLPGHYAWNAAVWFLLGALYTLVAISRRSSTFGLLAALAANFGLWVVFAHHEQVNFLLHPQLWLIPLALILLAAEMLNRPRLSPALSGGLRYLGLLLIYVSSTADMFIAGLGHSVALPIVLAVLSILGVLVGILLRVRAFLFLGVAFLFLVIFAQIWHAAVDRAQTWVWWASGIVLGAAVLALFALFEKRRNDVLKLIRDLKEWK